MGLPSRSVHKPVFTWVFFAALVLLGVISLMLLPVELYQGSGRGIVSIIIRARGGLAPIEVEHMITRPVGEAVSTVSHLKHMFSNSREAESRVTLEFEPGTNMKFAALEVREKFSRVKSKLPDEIEKPIIANYQDSDAAILIFSVANDDLSPEELREIVDQELKPRLDRVDGVASTEVYGGRERKILIELDRDKMYAYRISIERVMDVIGASNVSLLAGSFERGTYDFAIRTMGEFADIEEISALGIKATRQGSILPLKEIATIKDAYLEAEDYARLNLDQNVSVYVKKASLSNTISVVKRLKEVLDDFTLEQGDKTAVVIVSDKAKLIKRAIGDVRSALLIGCLLVSIIVYIALRRLSLALIVLSTIPLSIVSTFFFMSRFGLSINVMTLSGLALSIGILVDSAVIVIENTVKKIEKGIERRQAVIEGAEEMWLPLVASLLTSLCVFLPVIFIDEEIKLIYQGFTFTVCSALTMSLIVAVMFVPMLLSYVKITKDMDIGNTKINPWKNRFLRGALTVASRLSAWTKPVVDGVKRRIPKGQKEMLEKYWMKPSARKHPFTKRMYAGYAKWVKFTFRHRYLFILAVLILFGFSTRQLMGRDIDLPTQLDENEFEIIVFPLAGAKLDANDEVARRLEALLNEFDDVDLISTTVQKDDLRVFVRLKPRAKRNLSKELVMGEVREKGNEQIKQIHDEYSLIVNEGSSSEESKKLVINIFGTTGEDLERLAREVAQKISSVKGLTNLVMTDLRKRPEYSVIVDKGRAAFYGLNVRDVADSIHAQVRGMRPTKFHEYEKGREIETITRLQPVYRQKVEDLQEIYIVAPKDGTQIALKQIAGFYPSRGPQSIDSKNKHRYVFVKGDTTRPLETVAKEVQAILKEVPLPRDYFWKFGGKYEDLIRGKSQLGVGVLLSILLIYMVLACLYQSYSEPLMIMISIPLATIGVWAALEFTRKPLSEQVFIGMFILVGYAVNNSIILIDRVNHLKNEIRETKVRLVLAGQDRLRPILVTTVSTVVGFMPMAFSRSESAELWAPLAITMIGGIVSSTILILFVIPNVYLIFEDIRFLAIKYSKFWSERVVGVPRDN
jgi:hydrophobic/amphiphilic exporter-1 (mainly G- bacteria), HAE1 family